MPKALGIEGPVIAGAVKQFWTDVIWTNEDVLLIQKIYDADPKEMAETFDAIPFDID